MSGIAEVLLNLGHDVQGSDIQRSEVVERLERLGAKVQTGHAMENIGDAEVLVVSSAVGEDNPEVMAARARKIPVIPRAEMLAELMQMKESIAVAGAHGKTTAATLLATLLAEAGMDPTVIIGGRVKRFESGGKLGSGDFLVAEADESDGSFLTLNPTIAVVTSLDAEHLDHYGSMEKIEEAFLRFCNSVPFFGAAVVCGDDPVLRSFGPKMNKKFVTYGFTPDCDLVASEYRSEELTCSFTVSNHGGRLGRVELCLPGRHNALNALAAIQVALMLEVDFASAAAALGKFSGIARRSEIKGERNGVTVIDDYGHHPNEIRAAIKSINEGMKNRRLVTLFQPHRYSRTRDCLKDFFTAFEGSDVLGLLPIYPAGEKPIEGINSTLIYDGVRATGQENVYYFDSMEEAGRWLNENLKADDILLTLGAGDVYRVGEDFLKDGNG
jgi:UDP-N-acetylmuramate--alanine ligase